MRILKPDQTRRIELYFWMVFGRSSSDNHWWVVYQVCNEQTVEFLTALMETGSDFIPGSIEEVKGENQNTRQARNWQTDITH